MRCSAATLVILAGGHGRRMGRPKALLEVAGKPILRHLLDEIHWPGATLLVTSSRLPQPPGAEGFDRRVEDDVDDQGPLRGLLTGLRHVRTPLAVIATCDMPALRHPQLEYVLSRLVNSGDRLGVMLVVCFIRSVRLDYRWDRALSMDTDMAALRTFAKFLELGHQFGVPVLPIYDSGSDPATLIAEAAAMSGCDRILIGSGRHGALYNLIKGDFHKRLESLLPPEMAVQVISADGSRPAVAIPDA